MGGSQGGLPVVPWIPGAPPGGSLGEVTDQTVLATSWHGLIAFCIKFDVDFVRRRAATACKAESSNRLTIHASYEGLGICGENKNWSFSHRIGIPLGEACGNVGAYVWPEWLRKPSSNRLIFEKMMFHETSWFPLCFDLFFTQDGVPKRPKIDPLRAQDHLGSHFVLLIFRFDF